MCRWCKDIVNIHERQSQHDFMEQIQNFNGLEFKYSKNPKNKNIKKSILAKIEYQFEQLSNCDKYKNFAIKLQNLLSNPFDKLTTKKDYEIIMNEFYLFKKTEIFDYLRKNNE